MKLSSATKLAFVLPAKPNHLIATLGDATNFIATLPPEQRGQKHWYRAIHTLGIAVREPRYITLATINLQTALAMDHLLESEQPQTPDDDPSS